jgi:hypothetical protein
MCDMTRAKSSGERCIARQMKVTNPTQSTNRQTSTVAVIFIQRRRGLAEIAVVLGAVLISFATLEIL